MKNRCKRLTALVLALSMCFSLLSATAWAAEVDDDEAAVSEIVIDEVEETYEEATDTAGDEDTAEEADVASEDTESENEVSDGDAEASEVESVAEGNATVNAASTLLGEGSFGDGFTWTLTEDELLTISGSGAMPVWDDCTEVPWRDNIYCISTVVIEDGVTSIGNYAFEDAYYLTKITIPDSVTSIGTYAFYDCFELRSVSLPDGLTSIGKYAFGDCSSLTKIVIPDGVTAISDYAFSYCFALTTVTLGSGVKTIGKYAFEGCECLESVTIPDSVTSIEKYAFYACEELTTVNFGKGLTSIGDYAFYCCDYLSSLAVPNNVTSIGKWAFAENYELTNVVIGNGVTEIEEYTFYQCQNLEAVTLGSGITEIGESAFDSCQSLESINIPEGVTKIGDWAFFACDSLTSITIPKSVTSIGSIAFGYDSEGEVIDGFIIYGYTGSKAETYAKNNDIAFVSIGSALLATPTLSKVTNTTSGVNVTWKSVSGAAKYRVYRKTGSGSWTKLGDTTSTSYTDKTAKSGTTYKYTVRCISSDGKTTTSKYDATGLSIKYLKAGEISSLTNTSKGITVKWSKVSGASGYYLYRNGTKLKKITSGSTVSYSDTAVKSKNGTTYVYYVVPYSGSTKGAYTERTTVRLTAPTLSSVKNVKTKKMTVKWGKNSKATGYQIQYSTSSSFSSYKTVTVTSASTVSKTISSLTKGKKYYVRVRAYKTVSGTKYYSAWSSKKSVKISK